MKIKTIALSIALALPAVAATSAHAAGPISESASAFSYDHVGIGYVQETAQQAAGSDIEPDGLTLEGSVSLTPNVYANAEYDYMDDDGVKSHDFGVGLGYHRDLGLSVPTDVFAEANLKTFQTHSDADGRDRETAFGGKVGLRSNLGIQGLDTMAYVGMTEMGRYADTDGGQSFVPQYGVSADFYVTPAVSLGASYELKDVSSSDAKDIQYGVDEVETFKVTAKYHF